MEKLRVQCRVCGKELQGNSGKTYSCGCSNMMTVRGDTVSAVNMSDVIMLNFNITMCTAGIVVTLEAFSRLIL